MKLTSQRCVSLKVLIPVVVAVSCCLLAIIALCVYFLVVSCDARIQAMLPDEKVCGGYNLERILGGTHTDLDEFPWMALLEYRRKGIIDEDKGKKYVWCHGALISNRYVLTAAHCLKKRDLENWSLVSVRLGEYNVTSKVDCKGDFANKVCAPPALSIDIEEYIPHEEYDRDDTNQHHDIGLLRLKEEVTFTNYVSPICLPRTERLRSKDYMGKSVSLAGWGRTETGRSSVVKLQTTVPVKSQNQCVETYKAQGFQLMKGQLCAGGEEGKDSCVGDSGAPMMSPDSIDGKFLVNWYAIGIVSFGKSPCGRKDKPAVYTSVAAYMDWITANIRQ